MACICGCSADPEEGEVARAHLESRKYEFTRNADFNNLPGCLALQRWLDQDPLGVQAKTVLLEMARYKWEHHKERLTHAEVWPVLDAHLFYNYKARLSGGKRKA